MFLLLLIIVVVTIIVLVSNSKEKHSKFDKLHENTLFDLRNDGSEVKYSYYGKNSAIYVKKGVPTLYVLDEKFELKEYSLQGISHFIQYNHGLIELFEVDSTNPTVLLDKAHIKVAAFAGQQNLDSYTSVQDLIDFSGSNVKQITWSHTIEYENGTFDLNYREGYFSFGTTDEIYTMESVDSFSWNAGAEQHHYTTKKGRSGAGGAIVGGLTFGVVGAVAGGLARRKSEEIIEGNAYIDSAYADLVINGELSRLWFVSKETDNYDKKVAKLYELANLMEKLLPDVEENAAPDNQANQVSAQFADLRELKSLLDDGIITQEDFDKKKADILG